MCGRIEMNPHAEPSDEYVQLSLSGGTMPVMTTADLPRIITILLLAIAAAVAGGFAGMQLGEALSYAVARLTDRDIAELKDMLIWSLIAGMATGAAAGVWIVLALASTPRWLRRSALALLALVAVGGTAIGVDAASAEAVTKRCWDPSVAPTRRPRLAIRRRSIVPLVPAA